MSQEERIGKRKPDSEPEAHAYTDGASGGYRGPGGYGAILTWKGEIKEIWLRTQQNHRGEGGGEEPALEMLQAEPEVRVGCSLRDSSLYSPSSTTVLSKKSRSLWRYSGWE
jgi:ribonuclease HI